LKKFLFLLLALHLSSVVGQGKSDWERENEDRLKQADEAVVPPPALDKARLVELDLGLAAATDFHYFVDPATLSVGADRIVRYVVVGRSASGVDNVRFEGLRCPGEYRIYAVGRPDGSWGGQPTEWRPVPKEARAAENALARRYFCPVKQAIRSPQEGVDALRAGGHPAAVHEGSQQY
jgi:hypothetical protein